MNLRNSATTPILVLALWFLVPWRRRQRRRLEHEVSARTLNRFLILAPDGIGNQVLLLPLLAGLKETYSSAKVDVLFFEKVNLSVFGLSEAVEEVLLFPYSSRSLFSLFRYALGALRSRNYQVGIHTFHHPGIRYSLFLFFAGARYVIGANTWIKSAFDTHSYTTMEDEHEVTRHMRLVRNLDVTEPDRNAIVRHTGNPDRRDEILRSLDIKGGRPLLGMHPGCTETHKVKRWSTRRFAEAADRFIELTGGQAVVFVGPEELGVAGEIKRYMRYVPVVLSNSALESITTVMRRCSVFLSNDSGLMHLASAMGVPVVSLFGPTSPIKNAPRWGKRRVIYTQVPCSPCYSMSRKKTVCERGDLACMRAIGVGEVVLALKEVLKNGEQPPGFP